MEFSGGPSEMSEIPEAKGSDGKGFSKETNDKFDKLMGDDNIGTDIPGLQDKLKLDSTEINDKFNKLFDDDSSNKESEKTEQDLEVKDAPADDAEVNDYELSISNQDEINDLSSELKASKPDHSPALDRWVEEGGRIRIRVRDGKIEWIYINSEGIEVEYDADGYPIFPEETKHPDIPDINIGSFTGDRKKDRDIYMKILEDEYEITEIPEGYVLHHDSKNGNLQLIKKEYHEQFTHKGGHSKYKEEAD